MELVDWLRATCAGYKFDAAGVFRADSPDAFWPLVASGPDDLQRLLQSGGHLLPLPKEPAALANVLEVSIVDHLIEAVAELSDAVVARGTERGYPDLEISGGAFGGGFHAIDVKAARRAKPAARTGIASRTQSRITLYTGNTYFAYPDLHWPGTFRPFSEYQSHLDLLLIYTLDLDSEARVRDLEVIVQEPWRIGSKQRSSTTREYIGAVDSIEALRAGEGEFATAEDFYRFWRAYPFKISKQVQKTLNRLIQTQAEELDRLRAQQPST